MDKNIIENSSIVFDDKLLVNMTANDLDLLDSDGNKISLPTSAEDGARVGPLVLPIDTEKNNLGDGHVTTSFNPTTEGSDMIAAVKEYAAEQGIDDIRLIGSAVQKEAYAGDVVGMMSAVGRAAPGEKAAFADKFEIANDSTAPSADWRDLVNDEDKEDIKSAIVDTAKEIDGKMVINTTPHDINFFEKGETNKDNGIEVPSDSRLTLNAEISEVKTDTPDLVKTQAGPTEKGANILAAIEEYSKDTGKEVVVIGSLIAAKGYPEDVVSMTPTMVDGVRGAVAGEYNIIEKPDELVESVDADPVIEVDSPELDENTVGDSTEQMESKQIDGDVSNDDMIKALEDYRDTKVDEESYEHITNAVDEVIDAIEDGKIINKENLVDAIINDKLEEYADSLADNADRTLSDSIDKAGENITKDNNYETFNDIVHGEDDFKDEMDDVEPIDRDED